MNKYLDGITIEEIMLCNMRMFHFPAVFTGTQLDQDIEVLDLSRRAFNCLRRAGTNTLRDLISKNATTDEASSKRQLMTHNRNLGVKTASEILIKLFYYSFLVQPESEKRSYMQKVIKANIT
jgi:DNA-directed RNA polymerase, alpha subunit/40 kD subunit